MLQEQFRYVEIYNKMKMSVMIAGCRVSGRMAYRKSSIKPPGDLFNFGPSTEGGGGLFTKIK